MRTNLTMALAAVFMAAFAAVSLRADIYLYSFDPVDGSVRRTGRVTSDANEAWVCPGTAPCLPLPGCNSCHARAVDSARYTALQARDHRTVHFPKATLRLTEGQRTSLGTLTIARTKGLLVIQDRSGRQFQLPSDALVITGPGNTPAFITYQGQEAPRALPSVPAPTTR